MYIWPEVVITTTHWTSSLGCPSDTSNSTCLKLNSTLCSTCLHFPFQSVAILSFHLVTKPDLEVDPASLSTSQQYLGMYQGSNPDH